MGRSYAKTCRSTVIPGLRYRDAHKAIDWLVAAFGFEKQVVYDGPGNTVMHAQLTFGNGMIMIGSAANQSDWNTRMVQPDEIGGRETMAATLIVSDAAAVYEMAKAAGAEIVQELAEMPYGGKAFGCKDLEGHLWSIGEYDPWASSELVPATSQAAPQHNPYATFLGGQGARAVLAATPGLVAQAVGALSPEQVQAPIAAGKWSPRQIVAHLADCELVFGFRLRQTLALANPIIQPFEQDDWAQQYASYDLPSALEMFRAARGWNLKLIGGLGTADFEREMTHPERGTMTFQTVLDTMAGHDLNHLAQLQKAASS